MKKFIKNFCIVILILLIVLIFLGVNNNIIQISKTANGDVKNFNGYLTGSGTADDPWIIAEKPLEYDKGVSAYINGTRLIINQAYANVYSTIPANPIWTEEPYRTQIEKVEIHIDAGTLDGEPVGIQEIKEYAFSNLINVNEVTFYGTEANTLKTIGDYAFSGCTNLTSINIPDSVTSMGTGTFSSCRKIAEITIPQNITKIPNNMFFSCESLAKVNNLNVVTEVGDYAFCGTALTDLNGTIFSKIGERAFQSTKLTEVKLTTDLELIDVGAFCNCTDLVTVELPNVATMNACVFEGCTALKNFSIKSLESGKLSQTFDRCSSLEEIVLPEGITNISSNCFRNCSSLIKVTLPKTISYIGSDEFSTANSNLVIYTSTNSVVIEHAKKLNIKTFNVETNTYDWIPVDSISVLNTSEKILVGETKKINVSIIPEDATDKSLTFEVDDTNIATVTSEGVVEGKRLGTTNLTITPSSNPSKAVKVAISVERELKEVKIKTNPTKLEYVQNYEKLDLAGGVLLLTYNDESTEEISMTDSNVTVTGFDNSTIGNKTLTIEYAGKTVQFNVTIVEKSLNKIEIKTNPTKLEYVQNYEKLDLAGGVLLLTYNDESAEEIYMTDSNVAVTGFDNSTIGNKTLTIAYADKTVQFNVTIVEKSLNKIEIKTNPTKLEYVQNYEKLDLTGGVLLLVYNDESTEEISMTDSNVTVTGFDNTILGKKNITLNYNEKVVNLEIEIVIANSNLGDSNGDGVINMLDVMEILRHNAANTSESIAIKHPDWIKEDKSVLSMDVNRDGKITITDVLLVLRHISASSSESVKAKHPDWLIIWE